MKKLITIFTFYIHVITFLSAGETVLIPSFLQEKRQFELEGQKVYSVSIMDNGTIYAGTETGLYVNSIDESDWEKVAKIDSPTYLVATNINKVIAVSGNLFNNILAQGKVHLIQNKKVIQIVNIPNNIKIDIHRSDLITKGFQGIIGTNDEIYIFHLGTTRERGKKHIKPISLNLGHGNINQLYAKNKQLIYAATQNGLFHKKGKSWTKIEPSFGHRNWALADCRSVAIDSKNRLWFASPQGVGVLDGKEWILFEGKDGLPYNDFTKMAAGKNGDVWFGTKKGAIHFDGKTWEYRQGKRWLPDDHVNDIAVAKDGSVWIATDNGLSRINYEKLTLAEKAKFYEDEIDLYHRRTPYEFVLDVSLPAPGDKTNVRKHDSDNDGLWTGMYGAGECFAYAATKDPKAKARAKKVFEALKFLGDVTQDALISPPEGYVARTILPTSGPDPNIGRVENDIRKQKNEDKLWKVYEHRWPKSKDGKWYYKTDTSSDELDGHYFLYGLYYDLVADTKEEKTRVRLHVKKLTDHLIDHNFQLVDHDGKPTRWARYNPYELNHDKNWFVERGLNSLSMLSYLAVTYHMTDDKKYKDIANMLIEDHGYAQNMTDQKFNRGVGTGNHSDDEMAFMAYYHLINYETDPELKSRYAFSMYMNWMLEASELNPFFNFTFRAATDGLDFEDAWGTYSLDPHEEWLDESVETLIRFPLDRLNWRHENSHRLDIVNLHPWNRTFDNDNNSGKGYRVNGKVIPVDERHFNHWNHGPWELNTGGNGQELSTGTVFLLPYYMGLYHGFIEE
jgi:hypothetical protein